MMQKAQSSRGALARAGGNPMMMLTNPPEKFAMDMYMTRIKEQIREVESRLRTSKDERDQSSDSETLDKGNVNQIIGSFSGFAKQFSHKLINSYYSTPSH